MARQFGLEWFQWRDFSWNRVVSQKTRSGMLPSARDLDDSRHEWRQPIGSNSDAIWILNARGSAYVNIWGARRTCSPAGYDRVPVQFRIIIRQEGQPTNSRSSIGRLRDFKAPRDLYDSRGAYVCGSRWWRLLRSFHFSRSFLRIRW